MIKRRAGALITRFLREDEDGATAIEYGVIAALMAIAIVGAMASIADGLTGLYENVDAGLNDS